MSSPAPSQITSLLTENRSFPPPPEFAAAAHVKSMAEYEKLWQRAKKDPEGFWAEAAQELRWTRPWSRVLDASRAPFYRWFAGAETNTCWNALDRHVEDGRGAQPALIYDSPLAGAQASFDRLGDYLHELQAKERQHGGKPKA